MEGDPLSTMLLSAAVETSISGWKLFLTLFLVFLNGFFVAAEFAIVKVRMSQIEVRKGINQGLAKAARSVLGSLDGYLAATQLGITLASLGLGWIGESVMTSIVSEIILYFQGGADNVEDKLAMYTAVRPWSVPIAFSIITVLHIVFGELAPKSLAIRYPASTTFAVAWPLKVFYILFRPVIFILNGFANFLLRLAGIKPIHGSEIHSEEELRMIISESHEGGAIEETERELIQNVFDFDDRRVMNIYTLKKNVSTIEINTSIKDALDFAIKEGYSRFPVYEDEQDNIKGVLYTKDMMKQMMNNPEAKSIAPLLRKAIFISETAKIKNLLKEFQRKHLQMAIVTDEVGEFVGIVTMEDILEELVGEIQDEYDNEKPVVHKINEGTFLVNAHANISDINKYLPYRFNEGEHFDTLAGLINELLDSKELKEGDIINLDHYEAKVVKLYRNSVEEIELTLIDGDDDNNNVLNEE